MVLHMIMRTVTMIVTDISAVMFIIAAVACAAFVPTRAFASGYQKSFPKPLTALLT